MLKIYCDGSTKIKNQKGVDNKGGFGYIVYKNDKIIDAYSEQVNNTTNNEMELTALINVIKKYGTEDPWDAPTIYSDSRYATQSLTKWIYTWSSNNWKTSTRQPVENLELIKEGYKLLQSGKYNVNIEYCKGHNGIIGNELADKLAKGEITPEEVLKND
jgi:ribonuclease HI